MPEPCGAVFAPYMGISPRFLGSPAFVGAGASVLGRATIGRRAWLGSYSVIRADGHHVAIGDDFHLGEHATVHIAHEVYPTVIGSRVVAGRHAVVHACEIGDDCIIEAGAVVLDGSKVGAGAVISAGSIVFPRSELAGGWLYSGSPARPVTPVTPEDLVSRRHTPGDAATGSPAAGKVGEPAKSRATNPARFDCFVAPTARLSGDIRLGQSVGIWYGCVLDGGSHGITIGAGTNVQDNTRILCQHDAVAIAADVTIGHNVTLLDCRIDSGSLVGIGSVISRGTVVERDVLVAAGTETTTGQRLTSGQVWAGKPARPIGRMDDRKRAMLAETLPTYQGYAEQFRRTQHEALSAEGAR
ncbi:MAG: gamma carbonic anhydrase family protein [Alphaproteobacteria bacterium HGW-Alphaproteobacteria-6]|nr:MAG: gamma carbonic anhydrase family protein [Alphaproteobacteria bacterium HGW-Alphaproteobacteria-6]